MAYIPMTIGGKKYTETSLWTNSAPTSSFAAQTVNLSESIENFKYIGIKYCYNNVSYQTVSMAVYTVDELKASLASSGADHNIITLGLMSSGNIGYCRNVFYSSNTSVAFSTGYKMNASGTSNNACNPLEIFGLNELDHGKRFNETSLWTNSSPTSSFGVQVISLSDDLNNYDYIKIECRYNTSNALTTYTLISVSDFKNYSSDSGFWCSCSMYNSSFYTRNFRYYSDTSISSHHCIKYANNTTAANSDTTLIPTRVIGCKFA